MLHIEQPSSTSWQNVFGIRRSRCQNRSDWWLGAAELWSAHGGNQHSAAAEDPAHQRRRRCQAGSVLCRCGHFQCARNVEPWSGARGYTVILYSDDSWPPSMNHIRCIVLWLRIIKNHQESYNVIILAMWCLLYFYFIWYDIILYYIKFVYHKLLWN